MSIQKPTMTENTPKNAKKQQPTENQKMLNTEIYAKWGPDFSFSFPGGLFAPLPPVTCSTMCNASLHQLSKTTEIATSWESSTAVHTKIVNMQALG